MPINSTRSENVERGKPDELTDKCRLSSRTYKDPDTKIDSSQFSKGQNFVSRILNLLPWRSKRCRRTEETTHFKGKINISNADASKFKWNHTSRLENDQNTSDETGISILNDEQSKPNCLTFACSVAECRRSRNPRIFKSEVIQGNMHNGQIRCQSSSGNTCQCHESSPLDAGINNVSCYTLSNGVESQPISLSKQLSQLAEINQATMHSPFAKDASPRDGCPIPQRPSDPRTSNLSISCPGNRNEIAMLTAQVPERARLLILSKNHVKTRKMNWMKPHLPRTRDSNGEFLNSSSDTSIHILVEFIKVKSKVVARVSHKEKPTLNEQKLELSRTRPEFVPNHAGSMLARPHSRDGYGDVDETRISYPQCAKPMDLIKGLSKPEELARTKAHSPLLDKPVFQAPTKVVLHSILHKEESNTLYKALRGEFRRVHDAAGSNFQRTMILTKIFSALMPAMLRPFDKVDPPDSMAGSRLHYTHVDVEDTTILDAQYAKSMDLLKDLSKLAEKSATATYLPLYKRPRTNPTGSSLLGCGKSYPSVTVVVGEALEDTRIVLEKEGWRERDATQIKQSRYTYDDAGTSSQCTEAYPAILKALLLSMFKLSQAVDVRHWRIVHSARILKDDLLATRNTRSLLDDHLQAMKQLAHGGVIQSMLQLWNLKLPSITNTEPSLIAMLAKHKAEETLQSGSSYTVETKQMTTRRLAEPASPRTRTRCHTDRCNHKFTLELDRISSMSNARRLLYWGAPHLLPAALLAREPFPSPLTQDE
ncbi:hypothetical protein BS47DRAFT_1487502 [Hydnum rufescens UP504]|uniref:Uncharacterized protein n=1 Tax=Hydnum rufescens UP504 TaxID=1448309 RepID=A0A9P6DT96_9AGAM|nr:hypothetical protein BS47DRAFT_1487502 [Hydnum rufescens UP504]